jgi:hypothetical protein
MEKPTLSQEKPMDVTDSPAPGSAASATRPTTTTTTTAAATKTATTAATMASTAKPTTTTTVMQKIMEKPTLSREKPMDCDRLACSGIGGLE